MEVRGKKVFVGLSGGVDSGVTAALLKEQGADVVGVFIKGWYPEGLPCTWAEDRRDAMRVAAHLAIPFYTLDASAIYKKAVLEYLVAEYGAGRTPNPDIMCNRDVKFGAFFDFARTHGADYIATGHYARHEDGALLRGADRDKDQSYFLWAIAPAALSHTLFPLGNKTKPDVRELARRFGLPNAAKKDSQGICFLGAVSMEDFLRAELPVTPGPAVDATGKHLGTHSGALLATLGERIALVDAPPGPWYVLDKRMDTNTLMVGKERSVTAPRTGIHLSSANWFTQPEVLKEYEAQYRYHGPRVLGRMEKEVFVPTHGIEEPIAAGQSLVLYDGERVVGGGIIR